MTWLMRIKQAWHADQRFVYLWSSAGDVWSVTIHPESLLVGWHSAGQYRALWIGPLCVLYDAQAAARAAH